VFQDLQIFAAAQTPQPDTKFPDFPSCLVCGLYFLSGLTIPVSVNLNQLKATKADLTSGTSDTSLWPMAVEILEPKGEK
jgi:hypothetical protein